MSREEKRRGLDTISHLDTDNGYIGVDSGQWTVEWTLWSWTGVTREDVRAVTHHNPVTTPPLPQSTLYDCN